MKISLLIPAYNEEKYIGDTLEHAVAAQSAFCEIVVIDNASTDGTRAAVETVARKHPDAGIRIVSEPQKGLTKARQRGFLEARKDADILAYIDADTHMPSGWAETVLREFAADPTLALLSGPAVYYDIPVFERLLVRLYWWLALPVYWVTGYMALGANMAFHRKALENMGGFDTSIAFYGEDTDAARRAHQVGKVKFKLSHVVYFSGRRLKGQGFMYTARKYVANFFSQAAAGKSTDGQYEDFR